MYTKSIIALLAAVQLPAHVFASPLLVIAGKPESNSICNAFDVLGVCEDVDVLSGGLGDSKVRRAVVPIRINPPDPVVVAPRPGVNPAPPVGGELKPIRITPIVEPTQVPIPTAAEKPAATLGPADGESEGPATGANDPIDDFVEGPPGSGPLEPESDVASSPDVPNEPQGNLNGKDVNFNGYAIEGQSKAFTALDDAITNNKPDVQLPRFNADLEDPTNPGQPFRRYQNPHLTPEDPEGVAQKYGDIRQLLGIRPERFQDPDINLPVQLRNADKKLVSAAVWMLVRIKSAKDASGNIDVKGLNSDVVEMAANRDGSAIIISKTDASADFNRGAREDVPNELKKLTSSELIFQGAEVGRLVTQPASKLRVIMRKTVNNPGTMNTLRQAYSENGFAFDQKGVFRASAARDSPEGRAYESLMKTKNLEVSNFMLADHHQAFGNKEIKSIVTFPDKSTSGSLSEFPSADIFLILGPK